MNPGCVAIEDPMTTNDRVLLSVEDGVAHVRLARFEDG
jgi:hypothetical protein